MDSHVPKIRKYYLPFAIFMLLLSVTSYYFIFYGDMQFGGTGHLVAERTAGDGLSLEEAGLDDSGRMRTLLDSASRNGTASVEMDFDRAEELMGKLREASGLNGSVPVDYGGESYEVSLRVGDRET